MNEYVLTGQPRRDEPLWSLQRDGRRMACQLRDRGAQIGVEAQFLRDGTCAHSRSFKTRALAVLFAEQQRRVFERDDWTSDPARETPDRPEPAV